MAALQFLMQVREEAQQLDQASGNKAQVFKSKHYDEYTVQSEKQQAPDGKSLSAQMFPFQAKAEERQA